MYVYGWELWEGEWGVGADEDGGRHGRPLEHVVKCVRVLLLLLLLVLLLPLSGNNKRSNCGNNSEQDTLCVV